VHRTTHFKRGVFYWQRRKVREGFLISSEASRSDARLHRGRGGGSGVVRANFGAALGGVFGGSTDGKTNAQLGRVGGGWKRGIKVVP